MDASLDMDGGWKEAVTIVADLDTWCGLADRLCGWTMAYRGPVDRGILDGWFLDQSMSGEEALFHCGEEAQGFVRFVALSGVSGRQRVRSGAASWETGGIFSLMVRTKDLKAVFETALNCGWTTIADPVFIDYNGRKLANVILRGPDGVCFGVYERVKPPLEGWNHIKNISQPFNCMQIVRSRDATRDFHHNALGFDAYVDHSSHAAQQRDSQFGHPRNMTTDIETHAAIMHPRGVLGADERENGRVELIQWDGLEGRDLSDRAVPPNLGHMALRWPVSDIEASAERIKTAGYTLYKDIGPAVIEPYGSVSLCGVRTPDGVLYELFQPV